MEAISPRMKTTGMFTVCYERRVNPSLTIPRVHFSRDASTASGRALSFRTEMVRCPQVSSIKYHSPSHKILLTSREPDDSCGLYFFSPPLSGPEDLSKPNWLLGESMLSLKAQPPERIANSTKQTITRDYPSATDGATSG